MYAFIRMKINGWKDNSGRNKYFLAMRLSKNGGKYFIRNLCHMGIRPKYKSIIRYGKSIRDKRRLKKIINKYKF